jgi:hypothetical protein
MRTMTLKGRLIHSTSTISNPRGATTLGSGRIASNSKRSGKLKR